MGIKTDITYYKCCKCGKEIKEAIDYCNECQIELEIQKFINQIEM